MYGDTVASFLLIFHYNNTYDKEMLWKGEMKKAYIAERRNESSSFSNFYVRLRYIAF